jgi:hypothetical protein
VQDVNGAGGVNRLLADLLGRSDELGYRPRGIHRPEPAGPPTENTRHTR